MDRLCPVRAFRLRPDPFYNRKMGFRHGALLWVFEGTPGLGIRLREESEQQKPQE